MHILTIKRAGLAAITMLAMLVGCKKSTDVVTTTNQECQLQSELTVLNGGLQTTTTTYTYNSNGQLISSVASSSSSLGTPSSSITYTYSYDAAGNVITALTQGATSTASINITNSYEYTGGQLTKITAQYSGSLPSTTTDNYSYDGTGRIATYTYTSSDPQNGPESYTFTNGILTSGAITRGGQSLMVAVDNGHITSVTYPDGRSERYTYDANGYITRTESLNKAGTLQSYTVYEYTTTAYKRASTPYRVLPIINLYGSKDLPASRVAIYNTDGSLKAETIYQYQVNSTGYIASTSYTQNQPGISGQTSGSTTYTYSNCQ
ncbi:hypothetical protein GO755_10315 [Spirosoma sp. HMF4905]|uniref:RHS repeat protein n=1 Tax=Spirosoma arboris TaxID=2682092 RepID=A0A7K1S9D2_9BACT|nr:RHS repeat domain-containing protein [Spirosoma arboris]MVM30427.1 hypothetical protein [Spirosoma arboris]